MKNINKLLLLIAAFVVCSCTTDLIEEAPLRIDGKYVYAMQFEGNMSTYDDVSTRATSKTWTSGATVYVYNNSTRLGYAKYDGNTWTFTSDATLSGNGNCKAVHIDGVTSTSSSTLTVDAQKAVYEGSGTWSVSGKSLTLKVNLTPSLGRIRLKGSSGTSVSLSGLKTYTSFNASSGTFASTTNAVSASVQSNGYTPYLYGTLSGSTISTNNYTMTCPSGMMKAGTSGWVNYPTSASHTGWTSASGGGGQSSDYNGHEYVDLGLPSGLKWATCNVGASKPEEYGGYYAWGETEPYYTEGHSQDIQCSNWKIGKTEGYDWSTYKYCKGSYTTMTKYCTKSSYGTVDNKTVLDSEDDAAHVNWGGNWRMPTKAEQDELINNCTWTWTSQNGVNGYKVLGLNGKSLFLPAAGDRYNSNLDDVGSWGFYWSSSLYSGYSYRACRLYFDSSDVNSGSSGRYFGFAVRPVCQ